MSNFTSIHRQYTHLLPVTMDTALVLLVPFIYHYLLQTTLASPGYNTSGIQSTQHLSNAPQATTSHPLPPGLLPPHTQTLCFGFPAEVGDIIWSEPIPKSLHLNCPEDLHIQIQGAFYIRPDSRGDLCTSDPGCNGDACCCGPWSGDDCSVDIASVYLSVYRGLIEECENSTQCMLNITAKPLDDRCIVSGCNSQGKDRWERCWARKIQVYYVCTESWVAVTKSAPVQHSPHIPTGWTTEQLVGLAVGVSLGVVVSLILLVVIPLLCVRKKRRASRPLQGHDTSASFLQLQQHTSHNHSDSSYNTDIPADNHSLSGVNNNLQFIESKAYVPPAGKVDPEPGINGRLSNNYKGYQDIEDNQSDTVMMENNYYESITESPDPASTGGGLANEWEKLWGDICKDNEDQENPYEPLAGCVSLIPKESGDQGNMAQGLKGTSFTSPNRGVNSGNQSNMAETLVGTSLTPPRSDGAHSRNQSNRAQTLPSNGPEGQPYMHTYQHFPTEQRQRQPLPKVPD